MAVLARHCASYVRTSDGYCKTILDKDEKVDRS